MTKPAKRKSKITKKSVASKAKGVGKRRSNRIKSSPADAPQRRSTRLKSSPTDAPQAKVAKIKHAKATKTKNDATNATEATNASDVKRRSKRVNKKNMNIDLEKIEADPAAEEQPEPPLSYEEQEQLSKDLSDLPDNLLPGVFDIFKKTGLVHEDDEEIGIDVEMDALDIQIQRELQNYVKEQNANVSEKVKGSTGDDALSHEELEALSEAMSDLPENVLLEAVKILQKAGAIPLKEDVFDDDDLEFDLEELDTNTQRELQQFVMKNAMPAAERLPRVSDASESDQASKENEEGISRLEFNELVQTMQHCSNELVELYKELLG